MWFIKTLDVKVKSFLRNQTCIHGRNMLLDSKYFCFSIVPLLPVTDHGL